MVLGLKLIQRIEQDITDQTVSEDIAQLKKEIQVYLKLGYG